MELFPKLKPAVGCPQYVGRFIFLLLDYIRSYLYDKGGAAAQPAAGAPAPCQLAGERLS